MFDVSLSISYIIMHFFHQYNDLFLLWPKLADFMYSFASKPISIDNFLDGSWSDWRFSKEAPIGIIFSFTE